MESNLNSKKMFAEIGQFKKWAEGESKQSGEWESYYEEWGSLYQSVQEFIASNSCGAWTPKEIDELLYILARDNECGIIIDLLRDTRPESILFLAGKAVQSKERDAKWQLAAALGEMPMANNTFELLLLDFVNDEDEYVRRQAVKALARIGSPQTELLALREWERESESQQWARMNVLWCLKRIRSPYLDEFLEKAFHDGRTYLAEYALKVQNGEPLC